MSYIKGPLQLFLDFDGVICNSATECLFSSWVAYTRLADEPDFHRPKGTATPPALSIPISLKLQFLHLRPFIRSGDDYVLIQHLIAKNHIPSNQEEFDQARREAGPRTLARYGDILNRVRQELMTHDRDHWLRLNPLYPDITDLLRSVNWETTCILSTKRPQYIETILAFHQVPVPSHAIFHANTMTKLNIIAQVLDDRYALCGALVDDQLDHLVDNDDARIEVYLAAWGYVKPEWIIDERVSPLSFPELQGLLARTRTGKRS